LIYKAKDKRAGEKTLNRLKFLVDDGAMRTKIEELEKALNDTAEPGA
jgi:hypothetical protein